VDVAVDDRKRLQATEEDKVYQAEQDGEVDDDRFEDEELEGLEYDETAAKGQRSGVSAGTIDLLEKGLDRYCFPMRSFDDESTDALPFHALPHPFPLFEKYDIRQRLRAEHAEKHRHGETDDPAKVVVPPPAPELRDGGTDSGCRHWAHERYSRVYREGVTAVDGVVQVVD
jgi:hypothetical protein